MQDQILKSHYKSRPLLVTIFLVLSLEALQGCAFLQQMIGLGALRPKVELASLEVQRITLSHVDLISTVRIDNPNEFNLSFRNLSYELRVAGEGLALGRYNQGLEIPSNGHTMVRLPVSIDAVRAVKLARQLLAGKTDVMADIEALAEFVSPFGPIEVKIHQSKAFSKLAGF